MGKALIDQIAKMHVAIFALTGGDPLKRSDVYDLIRYAAGKGVKVALTPSATPLADPGGDLPTQRGRPGASRHFAGRLNAQDSRCVPRLVGRLGADHPGD